MAVVQGMRAHYRSLAVFFIKSNQFNYLALRQLPINNFILASEKEIDNLFAITKLQLTSVPQKLNNDYHAVFLPLQALNFLRGQELKSHFLHLFLAVAISIIDIVKAFQIMS